MCYNILKIKRIGGGVAIGSNVRETYIGTNIHYFRCSKGKFYARKRVSDVERFEHSAKKEMSRWFLMLIPT